MKKSTLGLLGAGLLALLGSSLGQAATITIVPSVSASGPIALGGTFITTVQAAGMPEIGAFAVKLTYDTALVKVVTGGIVQNPACPSCTFTNGLIVASPFVSGGEVQGLAGFDPPIPSGSFNAFQVTFEALTAGVAPDAMSIVFADGDAGWTDANTFEKVPVTYTNIPAAVVPAPASLWLLATALGFVGVKGVKARRSVA